MDLAAVRERLRAAGEADLAAWEQVRAFLWQAVGQSTFEIWLAPLELIAVDREGTLLMSAPPETVGWIARRFARVLNGAAQRTGYPLRLVNEVERIAAEPLAPISTTATGAAPVGLSADARVSRHVSSEGCASDVQSAPSRGVPPDRSRAGRDAQSTGRPADTSAYQSSYTDVYTQTKEVS